LSCRWISMNLNRIAWQTRKGEWDILACIVQQLYLEFRRLRTFGKPNKSIITNSLW
jgi:hypothetical protein